MPIADRLGREFYRRCEPHFLHKHHNVAYPVLSMIEDALFSPASLTAALPTRVGPTS